MEEYLYPGDAVSPVSAGENYVEYFLSDVIRNAGLSFSRIEMLYARKRATLNPSMEEVRSVIASGCYVLLVVLFDGRQMAIAPLRRHHNVLNVEYDNDARMTNLYRYSDAVLRYYINAGGSVFRPVWSKMVDSEGRRRESIGPEIESPFTLIWGGLVNDYRSEGGLVNVTDTELDIDKEYILQQ